MSRGKSLSLVFILAATFFILSGTSALAGTSTRCMSNGDCPGLGEICSTSGITAGNCIFPNAGGCTPGQQPSPCGYSTACLSNGSTYVCTPVTCTTASGGAPGYSCGPTFTCQNPDTLQAACVPMSSTGGGGSTGNTGGGTTGTGVKTGTGTTGTTTATSTGTIGGVSSSIIEQEIQDAMLQLKYLESGSKQSVIAWPTSFSPIFSGQATTTTSNASTNAITGVQGYNQNAPAGGAYTDGAATANTYIVIYGNFATTNNVVMIDGVAVTPSYQSANQINIPLGSLGAGAHTVTVTTGSGMQGTSTFAVMGTTTNSTGNTSCSGSPLPASTFPATMLVTTPSLNIRSDPSTSAVIMGSAFSGGDTFIATGEVRGDCVDGNDLWLMSASGDYVWAGGATVESSGNGGTGKGGGGGGNGGNSGPTTAEEPNSAIISYCTSNLATAYCDVWLYCVAFPSDLGCVNMDNACPSNSTSPSCPTSIPASTPTTGPTQPTTSPVTLAKLCDEDPEFTDCPAQPTSNTAKACSAAEASEENCEGNTACTVGDNGVPACTCAIAGEIQNIVTGECVAPADVTGGCFTYPNGTVSCMTNGVCAASSNGSVNCKCYEGFEPNPENSKACIAVPVAPDTVKTACSPEQVTEEACDTGKSCIVEDGEATCVCATGYTETTSGGCIADSELGSCVINPDGTASCITNGSCSLNADGDAVCSCPPPLIINPDNDGQCITPDSGGGDEYCRDNLEDPNCPNYCKNNSDSLACTGGDTTVNDGGGGGGSDTKCSGECTLETDADLFIQ